MTIKRLLKYQTLGTELYVNRKKVDMLQNPSAYLKERNRALVARGANTANIYANALDNVVKSVTGIKNKKDLAYIAASKQAWVKSLACDMATKVTAVDIAGVDIQFPILGSAYKAQFSQDIGEWPENQILIPDWTYFHCPGATLARDNKKSKLSAPTDNQIF